MKERISSFLCKNAMLLLIITVTTSMLNVKGKAFATVKECNYPTGHGFAIWTDASCTTFWGSHLGEFECPHQYDVKASIIIPSAQDRAFLCKDMAAHPGDVYTIAPEFILPHFIEGSIPEFTSDIYRGFFGTTIASNVSFNLGSILYHREFDILAAAQLTYYAFPSSSPNNFFLSHYITVPPDFDAVLAASIPDLSWPWGHQWPVMITFNRTNAYANRLKAGESIVGSASVPRTNGLLANQRVTVRVNTNIYPGPKGVNGDGTTDFKQYCVESNRPMWRLCV